MPLPYSDDLRWRIVWMHSFNHMPAEDVAELMCVSVSSVYRYSQRYQATGDVRPFAKRNGPVGELCEHEKTLLLDLSLAKPGIYLRELQQELYSRTMHWVDASTICRTMHRIGMIHQVIRHIALQRSELKRAEYWYDISMFNTSMLLWIDETGCDLRNALRKYGYGIRGLPPQDHSLKLRGKRYSAIGILSVEGIKDVYIAEGSVNGETFLDFIRRCLIPVLVPFDGVSPNSIVVMDNASIHHVDSVVETILSVGALVRFLPPYSPDMNPIEEVFGEVKHYLQANNTCFQETSSPRAMILTAFNSVTIENCNSYITHSGYGIVL